MYAVVVLGRVSGVVIDVHGIGPTCLLLLLCVVCPGVFRDRERERARAISRRWGQATRRVVGLVESSQFDELCLSRVQPVESRSRSRSGWLVRRRGSRLDRTGQLDLLDEWSSVVCIIFFLFGIDRLSRVPWSINGDSGQQRPAMDPLSCSPSYRLARLRKCPDTLATGANGFEGQEQQASGISNTICIKQQQ